MWVVVQTLLETLPASMCSQSKQTSQKKVRGREKEVLSPHFRDENSKKRKDYLSSLRSQNSLPYQSWELRSFWVDLFCLTHVESNPSNECKIFNSPRISLFCNAQCENIDPSINHLDRLPRTLPTC